MLSRLVWGRYMAVTGTVPDSLIDLQPNPKMLEHVAGFLKPLESKTRARLPVLTNEIKELQNRLASAKKILPSLTTSLPAGRHNAPVPKKITPERLKTKPWIERLQMPCQRRQRQQRQPQLLGCGKDLRNVLPTQPRFCALI